jgi:hypothetical protein
VAALDVLLEQLIDGQSAIIIHPRCTTLIKGLAGSYCFKRIAVGGEERYQDNPVKSPESHVTESAHYMLLSDGGNVLETNWEWEQMNEEVNGQWYPEQSYFE